MSHGDYGTSQLPLAGVILCYTSMAPEKRTKLGCSCAEMGATVKLDLTSDVTHLIVGNIDTLKYRYVAKSREDVRVLHVDWIDAVRDDWMKGGDVDVPALEHKYRLPTFYGLRICLTGFEDPEKRKRIQEGVSQNGAEYTGDLTKAVTHLIAAVPSGKKYEHALGWEIKVVSWEWFEQSMARGMTLEEKLYNPTLPPEKRGKGAWERQGTTSSTLALGKRFREAGQVDTGMLNPLRRKLRRAASSKLDSQSEALWADITAGSYDQKKNEEDDWTDAKPGKQEPQLDDVSHPQAIDTDEEPTANPAPHSRGPFLDDDDGIFAGRIVFPHGFDLKKTSILSEHLDGNGAVVIREASQLQGFSADDLGRGYLVVPHDVPVDPSTLPEGAGNLSLVTNWWVERCLHGKCLVDPTDCVLCRPFNNLNISGLNDLTINLTGFTGIELLHATKAVVLFGATNDDFLSPKISVMICNTRKPNPDKLKFATDKRIPAVHASWLWECISAGRVHPYDKYLINTTVPQPQKPKPQASLPAVPTAPLSEKDSFQLQKKMQKSKYATKPRGGVRQPGSLELSNSRPPTPASTSESLAHPQENTEKFNMQEDAQLPMQYDGVDSLPLQDIHPSVNSPRRPSTSSSNSTHPHPKVPTIEAPIRPLPAQRQTRRTKEPSPDSVIPAGDSEILPDNENHKSPETDYTDMMSKLLANRKTSVPAEKEDTTGRRKRRPLGRAQSTKSNTSTAEELLSRNSSASHQQDEVRTDGGTTTDVVEPEVIVEEVVETRPFEIPQPSQELGWDSPGAQRARENMIRAVGGKVIEKKGLERGGVVKDKVEAGVGAGGRTARRRRG